MTLEVLLAWHQQREGECFAILARATHMPKAETEALAAEAEGSGLRYATGNATRIVFLSRQPSCGICREDILCHAYELAGKLGLTVIEGEDYRGDEDCVEFRTKIGDHVFAFRVEP